MIHNIQGLRAFAAVSVIFVHLGKTLDVLGLPTFGFGGVDLFFVISGLIMVRTTRGRPVSSAAFLRDRITRLVPTYWTLTLAVTALLAVAPRLAPNTEASAPHVLKSLLFIPYARADGRLEPVLFLGWSLNYEMFFYLLFSVGLALPRREWRVPASVASLFLIVLWGALWRPTSSLGGFYTAPRILEFAFGIIIGCWTPGARGRRGVAVAACAGLLILALCALLALPLAFPRAEILLTAGGPSAVAVICALQLEAWGARIKDGILFKLGNASYSVYLTHAFVTQAGQGLLGRMHAAAPRVALLVGLILLSCGVGQGVHLLLERPLTRRVRQLWASRRARV